MILLKNIQLDGAPVNIYIQGQRIHRILPSREMTDLVADETVDCTGKAVIPGFINMHTHAAMILLRGITEDVPLDRWLSKIWAMEAKMDEEFIYWGTKAACLEMIRSGTPAHEGRSGRTGTRRSRRSRCTVGKTRTGRALPGRCSGG